MHDYSSLFAFARLLTRLDPSSQCVVSTAQRKIDKDSELGDRVPVLVITEVKVDRPSLQCKGPAAALSSICLHGRLRFQVLSRSDLFMKESVIVKYTGSVDHIAQ